MKTIKLTDKLIINHPTGTSTLMNIFSEQGIKITADQAAHLVMCICKGTWWSRISKAPDDELFKMCESHYYIDTN